MAASRFRAVPSDARLSRHLTDDELRRMFADYRPFRCTECFLTDCTCPPGHDCGFCDD